MKTLRAALPKADRNVKESPDRLSSWTRTKKERVWWGERGGKAGWLASGLNQAAWRETVKVDILARRTLQITGRVCILLSAMRNH